MNAQLAPNILIVEDERIVARDLQQSLIEMGYDAFAIAATAEEALAHAANRSPDVVLMDIRIQGQEDGIRTAELLKRRFPIALIYLTAHTDDAMIDRAKRTDPQGYLVKPVKTAELRSMIEIAMHRRDLDLARERLRASERRLATISDNVPVSIGYFDREGRVQFANRLFREMMPEHSSAGATARTFVGGTLYRETYRARQLALAGERVQFVVQITQGTEPRQHEVTYLPDRTAGGEVIGVYALGYDVTEREQLSADLHRTRTDLETILNNVPAGIASWRCDLTNRFKNSALASYFPGADRLPASAHLREVMGDRAYSTAQPSIGAALGGDRTSIEQAYEQSGGAVRWLQEEYVPEIKDGRVVGLYSLFTDVTETRRSHAQVRDLAQRLESVREEERRRVALILHDGIAQDLFAMKLGLEQIGSRRDDAIQHIVQELTQALQQCMDDIRQLASELRPVALGYFDAATVIAEHARRFETYSHIKVEVTSADFPLLDEATQLLFYRAAQEALTNIARHANASNVEIRLHRDGERLLMDISDDGVGISDSALVKPHSLGLLGLRERFEKLGGGFSAERRTPQGTTIRVWLPVPPQTQKNPES